MAYNRWYIMPPDSQVPVPKTHSSHMEEGVQKGVMAFVCGLDHTMDFASFHKRENLQKHVFLPLHFNQLFKCLTLINYLPFDIFQGAQTPFKA
jgi:hypothetical protein